MAPKTNNDDSNSFHLLVRILVILGIIVTVIFIGDVLNLSDFFNIHLRFDWAMILCSLLSAIATITLGSVSVKQNKRLSEINNAQLESTIVAQNYPLVKFCSNQIIKLDFNAFELKFYDTRNTPLKEVYIHNMILVPYSEAYKVDNRHNPILIQKKKIKIQAEFTPHREEGIEGFYFADIKTNPELFQLYEYYRLEFDLDVISTAGVVTTYTYKLLVERDNSLNVLKNRRYPKVYHQFYVFGGIMSLQKYLRSNRKR